MKATHKTIGPSLYLQCFSSCSVSTELPPHRAPLSTTCCTYVPCSALQSTHKYSLGGITYSGYWEVRYKRMLLVGRQTQKCQSCCSACFKQQARQKEIIPHVVKHTESQTCLERHSDMSLCLRASQKGQ